MIKIIAGYIVGGLLLLALGLLLIPLNLRLTFREGISFSASLLFFKFEYPSKRVKGKPSKKKKMKASSGRGLSLTAEDYISLLKLLFEKFIARLQVKRLCVDVTVGGLDAAKTAIAYGSVNAGVYALVGEISRRKKIKDINVDIKADFLAEKTEAYVDISVFARVCRLIPFIKELLKYLKKGGIEK